MSKLIHVTEATFEAEVLLSDQPVLVDFYADWCGPCKMLAPIVEQMASERADLKVAKVNIDEQPALAERYRIRGIPYIALFQDGKLSRQAIGYQPKATLEANLGLAKVTPA
ncbi:MAG TPA: thioredoxin [Candidatus Limnocylindria bacterium]|nr:MAG: thioredoxin [Chloroflexota bacterium]HLB75523.1 thioredoxin [Candidatus Dormibacteraeota bacterium]HYS29347.1 thioredoxin [Candidatus Limnocylindria bacterium]